MPLAQAAYFDLCETLPPGRVSRIIQIHPTLHCNLHCRHCYSSSEPGAKKGLALTPLIRLLEQAVPLGYNVVSLSGGEPFLYPHLQPLAEAACQLGYFNSVTTNGMLLPAASKRSILPFFHLVALSIDGPEEAHNHLRDNPAAFKKMLAGLDVLKATGRDFGFIHTALPESWRHLPWLVGFAQQHGARLLHIHPLEHAGRAVDSLYDTHFTPEQLHKLYIAAHYLQSWLGDDLRLQLDLLHRDNIIGNRSFYFPHPKRRPHPTARSFSHLFSELIVNENGDLLPIAHGCADHFRIGNIHEGRSLEEMIEGFIDEKFAALLQVYNNTYEAIAADETLEIINWSELLLANTHAPAIPASNPA